MEGCSQSGGSGRTLSPNTAHGTDATLNGTGSLTVDVNAASPEQEKLAPVLPASNTAGKWIETPASGAAGDVIRAIAPDIRLPDNSLFNTLPAPDAHYLIETDPRFTNYKGFPGMSTPVFTVSVCTIVKK
ncbi:hypothetical protein WMQ20_26710 [Escherichia coli]